MSNTDAVNCATCASTWADYIIREWLNRNKVVDLPNDAQVDLGRLIKAGILHFQLGNEPGKLQHPDTSKLVQLLSDTR